MTVSELMSMMLLELLRVYPVAGVMTLALWCGIINVRLTDGNSLILIGFLALLLWPVFLPLGILACIWPFAFYDWMNRISDQLREAEEQIKRKRKNRK